MYLFCHVSIENKFSHIQNNITTSKCTRPQENLFKENFKRLALKLEWSLSLSRGRRLQEVPNVVICLVNFWHVGKLVAEERGLLTRGDFLHEHHTFTPPIEACKFR